MKRKFINQIVLTAAFALAPLFAQAYVFEADGIYYNITSLSDLTVEVTYETTSYNSYSGKVTIPQTVTYNGKTYAVTSIGSSAFRGCTSLTSITIPDVVTSIGNSAFYNCSKLTSVTIPDAVTSIGSSAFYNCTSLKSVTIPDAVTSIGSYAFYKCTSLTSITIPDAVTSIGEYAFSSCSSLTSITIPDAVTSIGSYAFYGCTSLTSITIPDAVTSIGSDVFRECTSLKSVTIGEAVTSIRSYAFYGCTSLNEIYCSRIEPPTCVSSYCFSNYDATLYVPDDAVETYATTEVWGYFTTILGFSEVPIFEVDGISYTVTSKEDLEVEVSAGDYSGEITIPEAVTYGGKTYAVTSIGSSAFYNCTSLTSVTIGGAVTTIGIYAFRNCTGLESVTIPDAVTSIGSSAFRECTSLASVTIGDAVTSIGSNAFYNCSSLTSVTIGDAVTTIGSYAFYKCTSLDEIYSLNTTPPTCVSFYCFSHYDATLHVPTDAVETYASTSVWKKFSTIVGDIDSAVESVSVDETEAQPVGYYSLGGQRLNGPSESGATIIRYSDGTTKKVLMK